MAYCTEAQVRAASGFASSANVSSVTVTGKIGYADAIINAKIGAVYALPITVGGVTATIPLLENISTELAVLFLEMDNYGEESQNTDKGWKRRYDLLYELLEDIRQLKTRLYTATGIELDRVTTRQPSFYPDAASSDPAATDSTKPQVTMNGLY